MLVGGITPYCPYSLITMYDLSSMNVKTQVRVGGDCLMSNHTRIVASLVTKPLDCPSSLIFLFLPGVDVFQISISNEIVRVFL